MPVGKILFGACSSGLTYENELLLGYTLYDPVDDRAPRPGSAWARSPSGVEDAWITGWDYELKCQARWIPDVPGSSQSPIAGPNSWQQFMDYARGKNVFRFVPDATLPNFWVDGCYLVEPTCGLGQLSETKLLRNVDLTLRNPTVPWTQAAVRRVALEYAPGQPTTTPGAPFTFTRASSASYQTKAGQLAWAPANVIRDRAWTQAGLHELRLETSGANYTGYSSLSSQWSAGGAAVITPNVALAPDGSTTGAYLAGSTGFGYVFNALTVPPTTASVSSSLWVKMVSSSASPRLTAWDMAGGMAIGYVQWAWSSGAPVIVGLGTSSIAGFDPYGFGWYRAWVSAPAASSQTAAWLLYPDYNGTPAQLAAWGPQAEPTPRPSAYIATTGAASAVRQGDAASVPLPAGFQTPQASWWYLKFIERGAYGNPVGGNMWQIGASSAAAPYLRLIVNSGSPAPYRASYATATGSMDLAMTTAIVPIFGDTVEALITLSSSGSLGFYVSVNAAAPTSGTLLGGGGPQTLPSSWADVPLYLSLANGRQMPFGLLDFKAGPGSKTLAAARSA